MSIDLGSAVRLQLGRDLGAGYPPALERIVLPELRDLLDRVDAVPGDRAGSGAHDWADLDDRMQFIARLFRCYQESPFVFDEPFTETELEGLVSSDGELVRSTDRPTSGTAEREAS
jgi:hypothetical protein